jgi:hypothetical protein
MILRNLIMVSGFVLVIIGTAGLLLNEFVWESSSTRTVLFGIVNFVGLVDMAFAHFALKSKD